jgi:uroporphyrin-III C-methyltransferase / precorrin-2 dehydrogenase / sirohydrochlorin ferrochelatase
MSLPGLRFARGQPPRMAALARLPIFLALDGKRAVVAGDSAAAAWKVELLSAAGAAVEVFAARPCEELRALAAWPPRGAIALRERAWQAADLCGAAVAVGGFEDEAEAQQFAAAARAEGVVVNVIDKPAYCDFAFGAIVNRSPLVIGISTDGAAPVFAQAIRGKIEAMLPRGFARWAQAAQRWRARVQSSPLSLAARQRFWQAFARVALTEPEREPTPSDFDVFLNAAESDDAAEVGALTLIATPSCDPELLTLRAVRALQSADVILSDDGVPLEVLDFARREARKTIVGPRSDGEPDEIKLAIALAKTGKRVAWLSGDEFRADAALAACRAAAVAADLVPGVGETSGAHMQRRRVGKGA